MSPLRGLADQSPVHLGLAREAAESLVRRVNDKEPFKDLKLKDQRIVVWDKTREVAETEKRNNFLRPQIFRAYPPGYSQDRQVAIVRLTFPWSIHGGDGTYVLVKKEGKWTVLIREIAYYP
jgi:hypothetical protein